MKKIGMFLLAVVMVFGVVGCSKDKSYDVADMAGVYSLSKITYVEGGTTVSFQPPEVSGVMNLSVVGTYTFTSTIGGSTSTDNGIFAVLDDTIVFDGGQGTGPITDGGDKFSVTFIEGAAAVTFDFVRS